MSVDEIITDWLTELMPHVMASGLVYFAENKSEFAATKRPFSENFMPMVADFMKYRGVFEVAELVEKLADAS